MYFFIHIGLLQSTLPTLTTLATVFLSPFVQNNNNYIYYKYGYLDLNGICKGLYKYELYILIHCVLHVVNNTTWFNGNIFVINKMIYLYKMLCKVNFAMDSNPNINNF